MTNEELAVAVQQGDVGALETLWIQVRRYAFTIVKRYAPRPYADTEDYLQTAFLGVRAAALAFDPSRGGFLTLAEWCIRSACARFYGWHRQKSVEAISYDAPIDDEGGDFRDLFPDDSLPDPWEGLMLDDLQRDVRSAVEALPERERQIVRTHYFDGVPLEGIAKRDGISPSRIQQIERRAFGRLRTHLAAYERKRAPVKGVGLRAFQMHGASAVEHTALVNIEREQRAAYRQFEKGVRDSIAKGWYTEEIGALILENYKAEQGMP